MKIAFDYDGTISEDFRGWLTMMQYMRVRGHDVFVVTFRDERYDINSDLEDLDGYGFNIYYTRGVAKRFWCEQFGPGHVDVWIDDKPEAIIDNSKFPKEELTLWREENARVCA